LTLCQEYRLLDSLFPEIQSLSVEEMKQILASTKEYAKDVPMIAHFMPLFQNVSLKEKIELCKKLKLPNSDLSYITFLSSVQQDPQELIDWAHLYADQRIDSALSIVQAHLSDKRHFKKEHRERREKLRPFIDRIQKQKPLIGSKDLLKEGIVPGEKMGKLLKEAERIAINELIEDPGQVMQKLKQSPLWGSK
jgi:hypothetical protein